MFHKVDPDLQLISQADMVRFKIVIQFLKRMVEWLNFNNT